MYMLQKYHKTTRVCCGENYLHYTGPTYMPNQRINTAQKVEITKNSIGLSRSKGLHVCGTLRLSELGYRVYLTLHNVASCKLMKLGLYIRISERGEDTSLRANRRTLQIEWTTAGGGKVRGARCEVVKCEVLVRGKL